MSKALEVLMQAPVVPVLTIESLEDAVPLARALVEGGLPVLEVTLRTEAGLAAIEAIAAEVPDAIVGAGTVRNAVDFAAACEAGSRFIVSPGVTEALLRAGAASDVPLIPGIATVSELMMALDHDLDTLKFFPAEAAGGVNTLRSFAGPFGEVRFCPTGGIGLHNIDDYLALDAVVTVGGTWLTPKELVAAHDWDGIRELARAATEHVANTRSKA